MTIRILEDGDYRLQENGCIRDLQQSARILENGFLRTYQNGHTRQNQSAKAFAQQLQNCCGERRLESGGQRIFEQQKPVPLATITVGVPTISWNVLTNVLTSSILTVGLGDAATGLLAVVARISDAGDGDLLQSPWNEAFVSGTGQSTTDVSVNLNNSPGGIYNAFFQAYDGSFQNDIIQKSRTAQITILDNPPYKFWIVNLQTCPGTSC